MCSILGSICDKLCGFEKCLLKFGNCCSSTTIVIGHIDAPQDPFHGAEEARNTLAQAFNHVSMAHDADRLIQNHTITIIVEEEIDEFREAISLGILEFTRARAAKLARGAPHSQREGECHINQYYPLFISMIINDLRIFSYRIILVIIGAIRNSLHHFCTIMRPLLKSSRQL